MRYKHDKHTLTLSYRENTSTMTYWCEICERKIVPKELFYMCDEYCCVTLHTECVLGLDLYMKPGSLWKIDDQRIYVLPNIPRMSRPICAYCKRRCPYKTVFKENALAFCSTSCILRMN